MNKTAKKWAILIDLLFAACVIIYFLSFSDTNPADILLLFVLENGLMLAGLVIFFITFTPVLNAKRKQLGTKYKGKVYSGSGRFRKMYGDLFEFFMAAFIIVGVAIMALNHYVVDLFTEYFNQFGYSFTSSAEIEKEEFSVFRELFFPFVKRFDFETLVLMIVVGGRYYAELVIYALNNKNYQGELKVETYGTINIAIRFVLMPVVGFILVAVIGILCSIFGAQEWILISALVLFRLIVNYAFLKLSPLAEKYLL